MQDYPTVYEENYCHDDVYKRFPDGWHLRDMDGKWWPVKSEQEIKKLDQLLAQQAA